MGAIVAVVLAALCFATTGTAQALAGVDASPLAVGAARIAIGGGVLAIVAVVSAARARTAGSGPARTSAGPAGAPSWLVVTLGVAGVLAYQPLFFAGTRASGVAVGTVVALGSAPVVTGIVDAAITRRLPSRRWGAATAIALTGVVLVSSGAGGGAHGGGVSIAGLGASVGAGASYAAYTVAAKALLSRGWSPSATMGTVFGAAAVVSVVVVAASGAAWLITPAGAALAGWLGVVTTATAYLLFGWGLLRLRATTVSTLTLAEPLGATLLGLFVLHERIAPLSALGLVVIALGLVVVAVPARFRGRVGDASD